MSPTVISTRKQRLLVAAAGLATVALAGCSSTVAGLPSPAAGIGPAAVAAPASTGAAPAPSAAPAGGVTPTDTTLPVGKAATVNYATDSTEKETTTLEVTVKTVQQGSVNDLSGFELDAQAKQSDPAYVTVTFRNTGTKAMDPGGIFGLFNAFNTAGDKLGSVTLLGDFPKCDGLPPDSLAAGESFTSCEVYIAPKGQSVTKVVFGFYVDLKRTEITWTV
ncbi:hypothetical protein [Pseudonocardia sp. GCM10023141]|uniref:hypothetical protein n=1 Tax=Pseudonocardia sp. GCM10023141 TaxID=3252653 RepID=UPI0036091B2F